MWLKICETVFHLPAVHISKTLVHNENITIWIRWDIIHKKLEAGFHSQTNLSDLNIFVVWWHFWGSDLCSRRSAGLSNVVKKRLSPYLYIVKEITRSDCFEFIYINTLLALIYVFIYIYIDINIYIYKYIYVIYIIISYVYRYIYHIWSCFFECTKLPF